MIQEVLQPRVSVLGAMCSAMLLPKRAFESLVDRVNKSEAARKSELFDRLEAMPINMDFGVRLKEELSSKPAEAVIQDMLTIQFYRILKADDEFDPAYSIDHELCGYLDEEERAAYSTFIVALRTKAHEDGLDDEG